MLKPLLTGQWLRTVGLTVTLLLALLPARAQDIGTTFDVGNLTYRVLTENTVEVAGPTVSDQVTHLLIPATATSQDGSSFEVIAIGENAFRFNNLSSVTLPESVKYIGKYAFWNCYQLSTVDMPGVETIGAGAFLKCWTLNSLIFPETLTQLANDALEIDVRTVYFQSTTPPAIIPAGSELTGLNDNITIYVPEQSLAAYQTWSGSYKNGVYPLISPDVPAVSVSLNESDVLLNSGSRVELTAHVEAQGEYSGNYEWNVSWPLSILYDNNDESKVTIITQAPGEGEVSVSVTGANGLPIKASCKVTSFGILTGNDVILTPTSEPYQKEVEIYPASMSDDVTLHWSTSDNNIATVDNNGIITPGSEGQCQITVEAWKANEPITSSKIKVAVITELQTMPEAPLMKPDDEICLSIYIPNILNHIPYWESSDPQVAIFNHDQMVIKAIGIGSAIFSASYEISDGTILPVNCTVTVSNIAAGDTFEIDGIKYSILTENTVEVAGPAEGVTPTDVVIPASVPYDGMDFNVVKVGSRAFVNCESMTSITLPEGLTLISDNAFEDCHNLVSVALPSTLTDIGRYGFGWCYALTSIDLPASVTTIGNGAFWNCSKLSTIVFPASLASLGNDAIGACNLNSIYFLGNNPPAILTYDGSIANGLDGINPNADIYVPADSYEAYTAQLPDNADQIVQISRPANGAIKVELDPTNLLLHGREWKDVNISATVTTESGNEYDGEYFWNVSPNWSTTITTTEEAPNEASINLFNDQVHTVTVTVYSPEGTPLTASCDLIPLDILIPNSRISMLKGEDYNLDASITPDNYSDLSDYTDLSIRFTSEDPQLVEVSEDGVITALEYGTVNILAEIVDADGNTITQTICAVNVCNSVRPQYSDITIPVQNGTWNYALLEPSWNTNFTLCESDDPQIASVSNEGWILAYSVGETDITLTYTTTTGHTFPSVTCHVKVVDEITGIRISAPNGVKTMTVGSKLQLKAVSEPDGDPVPVNWRINDGYVAYVNYYTGEVTAKNPGKCTITAQAGFDWNLIATYEITVTEDGEILVDGITIDKSTVILNAGNSTQLNATVEPADAEVEIEWTSSNEDVASVDPLTGEVTANNTGVATITATVKGTDVSASCTVIVSNPTGIDDVDTDGVSVKGINGQIIVTGAPADAAVEIYSIAGSRIAVEKGNCAVSVNAGIYVVRVAGTTVKVAVK